MSAPVVTADLSVSGMTCAACQSSVQRALARHPGVTSASVNLLTGHAQVAFDPAVVTPDQLITAVEAIGYGAALPPPEASAIAAHNARDADERREFADLRRRAVISGVIGVAAMVLSIPLMAGPEHGDGTAAIDPLMHWTMNRIAPAVSAAAPWLFNARPQLPWLLLALTLFVMAWAGRRFYVSGVRALWHRAPDMNSLVAVGTSAAFLYSVTATVWPALFVRAGVMPDVYYEAVVIIIALVLAGRALEARARRQTSEALQNLVRLQPTTATIIRADQEESVPLEALRPGDVVLVRSGERVPVDGVVLDGTAVVDESMLTGESMPVTRGVGAAVTGGTLNRSGAIRLRATRVGPDSTLAQIVRLMRDAQASRAPIQHLADRVSAVFVPVVLLISLLTVTVWIGFAGPAAVVPAFAAGVAVLIIACPCAMGLAVPTAVMVATGRAGALGILIKGGEALQRLSEVTTIVLDKTGTLTEGRPAVTDVVALDGRSDALLQKAAAVESLSEHPLAAAIVQSASALADAYPAAADFRGEPGRGVAGIVEGKLVLVGSAAWLEEHRVPAAVLRPDIERLSGAGRSVVLVAEAGVAAGLIAIADPLRPEAKEAVAALERAGFAVVMLTGDRRATAEHIAADAGIRSVIADVLPEGKVAAIQNLQAAGQTVAMAGDGVNDAPALAQADVGIAMGSGTDIALDAADVALMRGDLRLVLSAVVVSRAAMRTMRQNLFWAFVYNCVGIPVAAGALYPSFGILLSPILASAAMAFSSVSVVSNSLRLRRAAA
jgi:Cu+-exporting ATPase